MAPAAARLGGGGLLAVALALAARASAVTVAGPPTCAWGASPGSCVAEDHILLQRGRGVSHHQALTPDAGGAIGSGSSIYLRGHTGMRITVQDGSLHAKWDHQGEWQTLVIEKADGEGAISAGDAVLLKAYTGNYLTAEGGYLHAHWDHAGDWQRFTVEKPGGGAIRSGDKIFLRTHAGSRITVEPSENGGKVHADWDHQGTWQELTIELKDQQPGPEPEPDPTTTPATTTPAATTPAASTAQPAECAQMWRQCGGVSWTGPTCCPEGAYCKSFGMHHHQCEPLSSATTPSASTTTQPATTQSTTQPTTQSTTQSTTQPATSPPQTTTRATGGSEWVTGTWTTGYWDCCKPSCSWPGKGNVNRPIQACHAGAGGPLKDADVNEQSACQGGQAVSCANNQPTAYNERLSFGFAAAAVSGSHGLEGDQNCGQCYELRFVGGKHPNGNWGGSHPSLVGKTIVIQVTNIGYDVAGEHSFDLQIPGAGQGAFSTGCTAQFPQYEVGAFDCDNLYGGCHNKTGCSRLPQDLQAGCNWRYDWYYWLQAGGQSNNPYVDFRRVQCPSQLTDITGSWPNDDSDYPAINLADYN